MKHRGDRRTHRTKSDAAWPTAPQAVAKEPLSLALALVLAVMSLHIAAKLFDAWWWQVVALAAPALALWRGRALYSKWLWAALFAVLATLAISNAAAANHTYLQAYIALALALSNAWPTIPDRAIACATNGRWLLVAVMCFAVLQKGLSADFRDGSYLSYLVLTGGVGQLVWDTGLAPSTYDALQGNKKREQQFTPTSQTYEQERLRFENPFGAWLPILVTVLAASIILSEAALAIGFALSPAARWVHLLLIVFASGLILVRPEAMFIATLSAAGALIAQHYRPRATYACVALGAIALMLYLAGVTSRLEGV